MTKIIIDPAGGLFDQAALSNINLWVQHHLATGYSQPPTVAELAAKWGTSRARVYRILAALGIKRPKNQRLPQ